MARTVDKQNQKSKKKNNNKKLNNVRAHHLHIFSCCQKPYLILLITGYSKHYLTQLSDGRKQSGRSNHIHPEKRRGLEVQLN